MTEILEMGKVCKYGDVLFVQYRISPVLTDVNTFYFNKKNGKSTNFFTPSVTQWHWNPDVNVDFKDLERILLESKEIIDCTNSKDIWLQKKMSDVLKMIQ